MSFWINLTSVLYLKFLLFLFGLLLDSLSPLFSPFGNFLEIISTMFGDFLLILKLEPRVPLLLVQVEQHLGFKFVGLVVNIDRVVVFVETFIHGLDGGFV